MSSIDIILPQKLSKKLVEKAEGTGYLPEELGVEILRKSLDEDLDPDELVEQYGVLSEKYLAEGKELLEKDDPVQASEKLWGAAALAIKMVAAKRGLKLERHGSLWEFVDQISRERKDEAIVRFFAVANGLHRNFYEAQMTKRAVTIALGDIERLIATLQGIV